MALRLLVFLGTTGSTRTLAVSECKLLGIYLSQVFIQLIEFADATTRAYDLNLAITIGDVLVSKQKELPLRTLAYRALSVKAHGCPRQNTLRGVDDELQETHVNLLKVFDEFVKLEQCLREIWGNVYDVMSNCEKSGCDKPGGKEIFSGT